MTGFTDAIKALNSGGALSLAEKRMIKNAFTELNKDVVAASASDTKHVLFDDFHGAWVTTTENGWVSTKGSGAATEVATTVANALGGAITMKSSTADGATSANPTCINSADLGYKANQGGLAIETRLHIDDITEAYIFVGFTDVLGSSTMEHPLDFTDGSDTMIADAANACGIVFSGDATTQKFAHGGVKATVVTTAAFGPVAPVASTYAILRVEVDAYGTVQGFIDGQPIGDPVANAITITTAVTPIVQVSSTAAAATVMTVDYIRVEQDR